MSMAIKDREVYATKVSTDLNELSTRLSILEAAAKQRAGDTAFNFEEHIGEFRRRRDEIENHLGALHDEGAEDWETTRAEVEGDIEELRKDLAEAMDEAGLTTEREKERQQPQSDEDSDTLREPGA
jgi:predicted  nucleic acid-binding Zn-ribbon protein